MNETEKDKGIKDLRTVISAKVQKLTSALYLVTNFLSDSDPLKWKLRDKALEILSQTRDSRIFDGSIDSIGQLISLIDVVLVMPGVSQMNFSLLKKEYEEVRQKMLGSGEELWEEAAKSLELAPGLTQTLARPKMAQAGSESRTETRPKPVNDSRRETILNFIKEHGWSSIKDIAQTVPLVSAKTVQRELAEMVQSGVLKKEGDRRWSRYHLS